MDQTANGQITKTDFILSCCELKGGPSSQWPSGLLKFVKKTVWLFSREGGGVFGLLRKM